MFGVRGLGKQEIARGTRKQFEVYITDTSGSAQDPDSCSVSLVKTGEYSYDSPQGPYTCAKTGETGYWGAVVQLSDSITLGDWVARFTWIVSGVSNDEDFPFVIIDKVRPYINQYPLPPNVKVVE
uniref:Uncharacterized protein n=1 Tax=viral metagenome TaxID=1070528 RepID=A0A6M3MBJ7_9ZZZZ